MFILEANDIRSVIVAVMNVPCCVRLYDVVLEAISRSGKKIPLKKLMPVPMRTLIDDGCVPPK